MQPPAVALDRELTLLEYGTCLNTSRGALLYERRKELQRYMSEKQKWLTLSFDGEQPCVRASHYVGLLPFADGDNAHLLMIAPKGCQHNPDLGLRRFLELVALGEDKDEKLPEDSPGWKGKSGRDLFLLFLAHHYANLLWELCRRDFRSYYRHEEGELRSRIRGRLHLARYARRAVRGKQHILPCRWDEFTVDNWDNRVLWAAARRLKQVAGAFSSEAAALVWQPFTRLLPWFGAVAEVPATVHDLRKCRLGRTSRYYRRALDWAELLLRGSDVPTAGGQAPPLVLDSNRAFEKFAEVVARDALPDTGAWQCVSQKELAFLRFGQESQKRIPDMLLSDDLRKIRAVGDAKYKDVLDWAANSELETGEATLRVCIQNGDWNQLYVYMRITGATCGFFIVPFWNAKGDLIAWGDQQLQFVTSPCDGNVSVRLAVLALNLLQPLKDVKRAAAARLKHWLSE